MKYKNITIYFAVLFFISSGPIFYNIPVKIVFILLTFLAYLLLTRPINISRKNVFIYFLLFLFLITTAVTCIVNNTSVPFFYSLAFTIAIFSAIQFNFAELSRLIEILTIIFKYVIILAWIGYFYSLFGRPLFSLNNPNGLSNSFYLTTFSTLPPPIRPAGFYDEPGALSFFICLLVFFRTYLGLNLRMSFFLLIGGLITQSLAHAFFMIVWVVSILFTKESNNKFSFFQRIAGLIFFCIIILLIYYSGIAQWAIDRALKWSADPGSAERVVFFNNALNEIKGNTHSLLFGFNIGCIARTDHCDGFTENFLTPIATGGLFASWPFYLFVSFCFFYPFLTFKNFSLIGIGLLLLQRPYFLELPYSFCLALIIALFVCKKDEYFLIPSNAV